MIGARGGFEIGTTILHMPRLHARRYRQFLKLVKAGAIPASPASRRKQPRAAGATGAGAAKTSAADDLPEPFDNTLPLIPVS